MSSAAIVDISKALRKEELPPPPSEALHWVMTLAPGVDAKTATSKLNNIAAPLRHDYIRKIDQLAESKFQKEPSTATREALFYDLTGRQSRLHVSMTLGLRSQDEIDKIEKIYTAAQNRNIQLSEYDYKNSYKNFYLQRQLDARLDEWQKLLEEIESHLSPLDMSVVRQRLLEEIEKPLSVSSGRIASIKMQLGEIGGPDVTDKDALDHLTKEHEMWHIAPIKAWLSHFDKREEDRAPTEMSKRDVPQRKSSM